MISAPKPSTAPTAWLQAPLRGCGQSRADHQLREPLVWRASGEGLLASKLVGDVGGLGGVFLLDGNASSFQGDQVFILLRGLVLLVSADAAGWRDVAHDAISQCGCRFVD